MNTIMSVIGVAVLFGFAYLASANRSRINWRTVNSALLLQIVLGAFALYFPLGKQALEALSGRVAKVLSYAQDGIVFLFGDIGSFASGFIFAIHVLPVIIFFSSLVAVLYHLGIMGWLIRIIGGALKAVLGTSRAESMSATANIFVSQTEAPMVIRPYIKSMTRSELFAVMVGGMATVAGSVLAGYVGLGVELQYLLAASFMAAPGGFLMAKLLYPETEEIKSERADFELELESHVNVIDAAATGASNGLKLMVNIGAMLLAFVGLIAMANGLLGWFGGLFGFADLSMQFLLGYLFQPLAFLLGVPWEETQLAGNFIGQKLVFNEFVAYVAFSEEMDALSGHTQAVVTFALCGFANFSSIAILAGGLGTIAPERRSDVAQLGLRAVMAAFMANMMSAAIAGFFLSIA